MSIRRFDASAPDFVARCSRKFLALQARAGLRGCARHPTAAIVRDVRSAAEKRSRSYTSRFESVT
jgi:hypothetical protein